MPECSVCTCMLVCVSLHFFAYETAGAASTRHSLRPLVFWGRNEMQASGELSREMVNACLSTSLSQLGTIRNKSLLQLISNQAFDRRFDVAEPAAKPPPMNQPHQTAKSPVPAS